MRMSENSHGTHVVRKKTNFDLYLEEQVKDPIFVERFEKASEAWIAALQPTSFRKT
jgi:hypothetical protein